MYQEYKMASEITPDKDDDDLHSSIMKSMREKMGMLSNTQNEMRIDRVSSRLRELNNEDAYTPRIVSIGLIHWGIEELQAMEVYKTRYMKSIFQRTIDEDRTLSKCVQAILKVVDKACSCYNHESQIHFFTKKRPAEFFLVDGCFLLELFLRFTSSVNSTENNGDPIFGATTIRSLRRDLALLENQIPFFVLEGLFGIIMKELKDQRQMPLSLNKLCASFFYLELNSNQSSSDCKHLLGLIRECYLPGHTKSNDEAIRKCCLPRHSKSDKADYHTCDLIVAINCCMWSKSRTKQKPKKSLELIHCVTKLRECGIKFVKGSSENLFDIKFNPKLGVLEIPELCIDDTMDSLLRNMIAFEQCCNGIGHQITSYAILMDCLIDSPGDAEFLQHERIIANYLGHGEEVSNIFNKISKKVYVEDFYFAELSKQVNEYCNRNWPRRRESLVRDHCSSPWKVIGLFAGSILLLFAGLQTGYTMASYHYPPK